jgi:tRNA (cytidine56-2'-O)-methyltransferase
VLEGKQFEKEFPNAKRKIIPTKKGKNVQVKETRD